MKKIGPKPRKTKKMRYKDVSHLPYSSAEHQIELARRSLARIPEWVYNGKRINGTEIKR